MLGQQASIFLASGTGFIEDNSSTDGVRWGVCVQLGSYPCADEVSLIHLLLTGHRRVPVRRPGVEDPCARRSK